jgi:hypothetical protein
MKSEMRSFCKKELGWGSNGDLDDTEVATLMIMALVSLEVDYRALKGLVSFGKKLE